MLSLYEHLVARARLHPERVALVACDEQGVAIEEISYAALLQKVETAARFLCSLDLCPGDRLALNFSAGVELLTISWAAWAVGVVTVPLDTKRDTGELRDYKMKISGAKLLLQEDTLPADRKFSREIPWASSLEHEALILFTSGTTARPKGAQLTLHNLVINATSINEWLEVTEEDRFLVQLPLHHINSTTFCLSALIAGASIALPPGYSNSRFWAQAANSGATYTSIVPSIVFDQLDRMAEFTAVKHVLKLRRIQLGSAPVVVSAAEEFIHNYAIPLYQGYGQTETALRVTGVPMNLRKEIYTALLAENSIGSPMSWAEVEIADEAGTMLGENEEGEIIVRGAAVMQGYVAGEFAFRNGYFLTGDIGLYKVIEGHRFFFLKGRKKEIIIKGGVNISPLFVEDALLKISADIRQVYVVGVNDERYGEEVGAVVVWKNDVRVPDAMRRLKMKLLLGASELSKYESPRYLTALPLNELPTTSTGKVQRTVLKSMISRARWESLHDLFKTSEYRFVFITSHSSLIEASHALHNHCWQPLTIDRAAYTAYLQKYLTLAAIDKHGRLQGQISFSYKDTTFTCVSVCSATFKPKQMPTVTATPSQQEVREYLLAGHDPVMNFHQKMGAELVEVIPNGRPADKSSLGYTMMLRYPPFERDTLTTETPVSNQLIEAVRLLGKDLQAQVYALSRPGGLSLYLNRTL